jgi:hypothetical protein
VLSVRVAGSLPMAQGTARIILLTPVVSHPSWQFSLELSARAECREHSLMPMSVPLGRWFARVATAVGRPAREAG